MNLLKKVLKKKEAKKQSVMDVLIDGNSEVSAYVYMFVNN